MDDGVGGQKRRSPRSKLLMAASLEHHGHRLHVTLRDFSAEGALIEGEHELQPGASVVLHRNELSVAGRVAWAEGRRAGIAFCVSLDPETVLRHVPRPKTPTEQILKKRPGFRGRMSAEERRIAEELWGGPLPPTH